MRISRLIENIRFDLHCWLGLWLFEIALRFMPPGFSTRQGIQRGIYEQGQYDRYYGFTVVCGGAPLPFQEWRQQYAWLRTRPANQCKVRDKYAHMVIRETEAAPL